MNYIKHLTGFFDRIVHDRNLNPTHISLYIALFQFWNINRFQNPISITRDEVMRISKICSKATYHKCMRELNEKGYVKYEPSFNPFKGSMVILFNFSEDLKPVQKKDSTSEKILPVAGQVANKLGTSYKTSTEQALVPSINNTNNTNNTNLLNDLNLQTQPKKTVEKNESIFENNFLEKEKSSAKKEKDILLNSILLSRVESLEEKPSIEIVKTYFAEQNFPELESQKFFNYFSSIGWLVGGKTPMVNWQAAAQNWMINAPKFIANQQPQERAYQLQTAIDKDYSEPL